MVCVVFQHVALLSKKAKYGLGPPLGPFAAPIAFSAYQTMRLFDR